MNECLSCGRDRETNRNEESTLKRRVRREVRGGERARMATYTKPAISSIPLRCSVFPVGCGLWITPPVAPSPELWRPGGFELFNLKLPVACSVTSRLGTASGTAASLPTGPQRSHPCHRPWSRHASHHSINQSRFANRRTCCGEDLMEWRCRDSIQD